jgi:hypothetical protein
VRPLCKLNRSGADHWPGSGLGPVAKSGRGKKRRDAGGKDEEKRSLLRTRGEKLSHVGKQGVGVARWCRGGSAGEVVPE